METEPPLDPQAARHLTMLRWLVTVLTVVMIVGLITVVALLVTRLRTAPPPLPLPDTLALPEGATATAVTRGSDWLAVVTAEGEILVFDLDGRTLRQRVTIEGAAE